MTEQGLVAILSGVVISVITYFASKRGGEKRNQDTKDDGQEFTKSYVDQYITQLQERIEECKKLAVAEANAAKYEVRLLNLRTTDLELELVALKAQLVDKDQEVLKVEGERDVALAERKASQESPDVQSNLEPR